VVLGDRLDDLGREAHHAQRSRTDVCVGRAELLVLDVDQLHLGMGAAPIHRGVVAARRAPEHERAAEIVEQPGAERVVGLDADPARDRRRGRRRRERVLPEAVGDRATRRREQVERGGGRDGTRRCEAEHGHGAPCARDLAREAVERRVREANDLSRQRPVGVDEPAEIGGGRARVLEHPQKAQRGTGLQRQLGDLGDQVVAFGGRHQ
jgi:hypothetical protein